MTEPDTRVSARAAILSYLAATPGPSVRYVILSVAEALDQGQAEGHLSTTERACLAFDALAIAGAIYTDSAGRVWLAPGSVSASQEAAAA